MANEKRLCNAEAIARKLKNAHCAECNIARKIQCSACWVEDVLELLEGDAVDAVEVVHGRWEDVWGGKYANKKYRCSVCRGKALYDTKQDSLGSWSAEQELTPICPHCGAKMDGDGNA